MYRKAIPFVLSLSLVAACQTGTSVESQESQELPVVAGPEAQDMGILEYRVVAGDTTIIRMLDGQGAEYGVLVQWTDDADINHMRVTLTGVDHALELRTQVADGEISNAFYVANQLRGRLVQSADGDVHSDELLLDDVVQHIDAMRAVRGDSQLDDILGDPSEEYTLFGSCPGILSRLLSCGVCALSKTVCLLSPDRNQCFQDARKSADCKACVCK